MRIKDFQLCFFLYKIGEFHIHFLEDTILQQQNVLAHDFELIKKKEII